jgi:hypothetical protein
MKQSKIKIVESLAMSDGKHKSSKGWTSLRGSMGEHGGEIRGAKKFSRNYLRCVGVLIDC